MKSMNLLLWAPGAHQRLTLAR